MAPPANSVDLEAANKGEKSNSKDKRNHRKDKHDLRTAGEASLRNEAERKHEDGQEGKEHGKNPRKEKKAEATGPWVGEVKRAMEDERFAPARTDPRFRPMRREEAKVALDSRFSRMLTDPVFASSEAPVDKRGRRRKKGARENPVLHCYLGDHKENEKKKTEKLIREEEDDELEEEDHQNEQESSSSDDDQENDDQYSLGSDIAHYLIARHDDTPMIDKETHRLAVSNMDWDHIKAVDLYMVMKSCIPKGGRVLSVSVYPSEFGLKCMNIETTQGPSALVGADDNEDDNNDNEDDGDGNDDGEEDSDRDSETENNKLRTYELNRLRYYHAVVVCDSSATADHLYTTLDGTEFLKTANVFDLRFISDSTEFKHPARDVAREAPPNYQEPDFETAALHHRKVRPTWEDDEPDRKKLLSQRFKEDQLDGLATYFASDGSTSDSDESGDESLPNCVPRRKLTNKERLDLLLQGDNSDKEQTDDQDMEVTFNTELEDLSKRTIERKSTETKTVWEMHQEKLKEKRKARKRSSKDDDDYSDEDSADEKDDFFDDEEAKSTKKQKVKVRDRGKRKGKDKVRGEHFEPEATREELELLVAASQDAANSAKGYNITRKSKKGKRGKDSVEDKLPEIDLSKDPRFEDMFTSHLYALDPTNPQYKRSATFMRKKDGKKGAHTGRGTLDCEPPVEESSLGNRLPPDDASAKNANQKHVGASMEKLQMLSAVKSLKRNLTAFKKASMR